MLNGALLLIVIWKVMTGYWSTHVILGAIGFLFFIYNWTRHAIYSSIRSDMSREWRVKFAQLSKKKLRFHKYTGTTALIFILLHGYFVLSIFNFQWQNVNLLSGLLAGITLLLLVITGWIRFFKTTYAIRLIHLGLGLTLFTLVTVHVLL